MLEKLKNLTALGIGNIVTTVISGLFWIYIASIVEVKEYGEIGYMLSIAIVVSGISLVGARTSLTVFASKGESIIRPLSIFTVSIGLLISTIVYMILLDFGASIYVIGFMIFTVTNAELLGKKLYITYSKHLIVQRTLMVILSLTLFYLFGYQFIILGIAISFLPFSIKFYNLIKNNKVKLSSLRKKKEVIISNYALEITGLLPITMDRIIIGPLFGFIILGNYFLGLQVLMVLTIIPTAVYQYILPQDASKVSTAKIKKIIIIISVIFAILGFFLSPILIPVALPKYSDAIEMIQIMSFVVIPVTINLIYASKFIAELKTKIVIIGSIIFISAQILGLLSLVEYMGANGFALSLLIADSIVVIYYIIIHKYYKI
jgi:O-antigen/teichoic acid export membrane protein